MAQFASIEKLPKLGFGLMRLPTAGGAVDIEAVKRMADAYMQQGWNYFDTAYMYHDGKSEVAFNEAVAKRYPRESYAVATKLPIWFAKTKADVRKIFETQLERSGAGYFDLYLHHCMNKEHDEQTIALDGYETIKAIKGEGKIGHIGFSFHGDAKTLEKILAERPEMEFVQLQLNYLDWDGDAGEFYRICRRHNKPIIIMEPVKGGALSKLTPSVAAVFDAADKTRSYASWAIRWCAELEGVATILSGMSNDEQMADNIKTIKESAPLTPAERAAVSKAAAAIRSVASVPCTDCRYCKDCPQGIPINDVFRAYNKFLENQSVFAFHQIYDKIPEGSRAEACVACGACESVCPQRIEITKRMGDVARLVS